MRNTRLKKVLSSLLVVMMFFTMIPTSAFADAPNTQWDNDGVITVTVKDSITGTPIQNATVKLEDLTAGRYTQFETKTTNAKGQVSWTGLLTGEYRVTQTGVPDAYYLNSNQISHYLDASSVDTKTCNLEITNLAKQTLYIYRVNPDNGNGLAGAYYKLTNDQGEVFGPYGPTDANGYLAIPKLPADSYVVEETTSPNGYMTKQVMAFEMKQGGTEAQMLLFGYAQQGTITVYNFDADTNAPISGSKWTLTKADGTVVESNRQTNTNGLYVFDNLDAGSYVVKQVSTKSGYIPMQHSAQVVIGKNGNSVTHEIVQFADTQYATITVHVADSVTGADLAGIKFSLYDNNNKLIQGPTQVNAKGNVTFEDLVDGTYTIRATTKDGYMMDINAQSLHVDGAEDALVQFTATPLGSILIKAVDEATGTMLPGCSFTIKEMNGNIATQTATTGADGTVQVTGLENGYYIIQETKVPNGYVMESITKTVFVDSGKVENVIFAHREKPYIVAQTFVKGTTTPIPGSVVNLYNDNGVSIMSGTTGNDGQYTFMDLTPGTYTVKYQSAPAGYTIDASSQTVVVTKEKAGLATLYASRHSAIDILKVDDKNQKPLVGATFLVRDAQGVVVDRVTTDAVGHAVTKVLTPGRYQVQEMFAPEGYVPTTVSQAIEVINNQTSIMTFTNQQKPAVVVYAYDNDGVPMANVSYILYNNLTGQEVASQMTNAAGVATFENLTPGTYMVSESVVPDGYVLVNPNQSRVIVNADAPSYVRFVHIPEATIQIQTADIESGAAITGAVYQVMNQNGTYKANFTTDANGEAITPALELGTYTVKQIEAPDGYQLNTTTQTITVLKDRVNLAKFFNKATSRIVIENVVSGENFGLQGVTVTVENEAAKEVSRGTTLQDGLFTTGELDPGKYTVKVVATPDGYTCIQKQRTVEVTYGQPSTVKFEFTRNNEIVINLTDASDSTKGLANSKFRVEKIDSDFAIEVTTDNQGVAKTGALENGKYMVSQLTAPEGYILDRAYQWATVDASATTVLDFTNRQISGLVINSLTEVGHEPLAGAEFEIWEQNGKLIKTVTVDSTGTVMIDNLKSGIYLVKEVKVPTGYTARTLTQTVTISVDTPTTLDFYHTQKSALTVNKTDATSKAPLEGATFRITTSNGVKVGDYTTNANGQFVVDSLNAGTYTIAEVKAPEGYVLDGTPKTFTIKDNEPLTLDFTNKKISSLEINTLTEKGRNPIAGATYEVWQQNGKLVATVTSATDGKNTVTQLAPGNYVVKEVKVPAGYTARTLTQNVTITTDDPSVLYFYHTAESSLTVNKTDARTGKPVVGAEYRITKANGDYVGDYTTDASGKIVIATLPAGTYNIAETKAPDGYILDTTSKSFTIKDDQALVLDLTNEPESGLRIINTCKQDGRPIGGNTFKIVTYDGKLVGNYTTNEAGLINVTLDPGTYTVYQTYVKDGYVKNDTTWNVVIKAGENTTLEVQNEGEARILVHFVDADTNARIYGVEMEIKDKNNNYVGRFKSNNEGMVELTDVLNEGKYILTIWSVPNGYDKDTVPKTVVVEMGKTTEITWKLNGHKGQVTIVTYSGEDNAMMNIRKNSKLSGAVYQITNSAGKVVGTIRGDVNGNSYSGALAIGNYTVQQIQAPTGWQVNGTPFKINVTSLNDNIRVEVYNKAANYQTSVSVHGQATAMAGAQVKYYVNLQNKSTSNMDNFALHIKVPTDAMRANTFYTGTYSGAATTYRIEVKTNMNDYRVLANGLNSKSQYSYGLSTQALGLQSGEYVTDIRMVFNSVVPGFKNNMAPTLTCYVLSTIYTGHNAIMRAEVGAMSNGYYSNNSSGGIYGSTTGQNLLQNGASGISGIDNGWVSSAGQFNTYVYGYFRNVLPWQLPKTGF